MSFVRMTQKGMLFVIALSKRLEKVKLELSKGDGMISGRGNAYLISWLFLIDRLALKRFRLDWPTGHCTQKGDHRILSAALIIAALQISHSFPNAPFYFPLPIFTFPIIPSMRLQLCC